MPISPQQNKYSAMPAYKRVERVHLRCLKDGTLRAFLNDGPFPFDAEGKPIDSWQARTPQSGRSQLIKKMTQKEPDPLAPADEPDATIHIFVWEGGKGPDGKDLPIPKIWDPKIGDYRTPARMTEHHRAVMARFIDGRNKIAQDAERDASAKREEEANRMRGAIASVLASVAPPPAPPKPPKGGAA